MVRNLSIFILSAILLMPGFSQGDGADGLSRHATILRGEALRDSSALASLLTAEDEALRVRALWAMARIGDPGDLKHLLPLIGADSADVRGAAAVALGEIFDRGNLALYGGEKEPRAVESLQTLLGDSDPMVAVRAAEALGKIGAAEASEQIGAMLADLPRDSTASVELRARLLATALMRLKAGDQAGHLIAAADHPSPRVRATALAMLGRLTDDLDDVMRQAAAEAARAKLGGAPWEARPQEDDQVQAEATKALGRLGAKEDVERLLELVDRPNQHLGVEATRAVAALGAPERLHEAFERLASQALESEDWVERNGEAANRLVVLIQALAIEDEQKAKALPAGTLDLLQRLRGLPSAVGYEALATYARLMKTLGTGEKVLAFPEGYRINRNPALRAHVVALGVVGHKDTNIELFRLYDAQGAPPAVKRRIGAIFPHLVDAISRSLYELGKYEERQSFLLQLLDKSEDPLVRAAAAQELALEEGGKLADYPLLAERLIVAFQSDTNKNPDGRLAVLEALKAGLELENVRRAFEDALADPSPVVRRLAMRTLGRGSAADFAEVLRGTGTDLAAEAGMDGQEFYAEVAERAQKRVVAEIEIKGRGAFAVELLAGDAPLTVDNFVRLATKGRYDGLPFHRVVPNFVVQGGDPRGDGWGGPNYAIPDEINAHLFERGSVGMAHAGRDTAGSQFFICHAAQPHLDGAYTVFGRMIVDRDALPKGASPDVRTDLEFLDQIVAEDTIGKVVILEE